MRFSVECAFPHLRRRRPASRKSALCPWALTENRTLAPTPHAKTPECAFPRELHTECAFPYGTGCRMRFSVKCAFSHLRKRRPTSRKSAFWPRRLTQRRTLSPAPHAKAHSACVPSPKDALCIPATATKKRCNPSSAQRDPSAARPGKTWRGERPSSCGGATDPHPYPYLHPQRPVPCASKTPGPALGIGLH